MQTMTIYGDIHSGNCQKVKFLADYLRLPYEWVAMHVLKGETRTSAFLAMNPDGKVPLVRFADGRTLAQSNAIIRYLGRDSALLPKDAFLQAKVDEWMAYEQYSHEPFVAGVRFERLYLGKAADAIEVTKFTRAENALDLMEHVLTTHDWFVGDTFTLADLALLPYTRMSQDGGLNLEKRPQLRNWIRRSEAFLGLSPYRQTYRGLA